MQIIEERMKAIEALALSRGAHEDFEHGVCVMEAVSYVAGESWSDAPQCACPVIGSFLRSWNDGLPSDADRDRLLKPLIPLIVGTRSTEAVKCRRAVMVADWYVRTYTPTWLHLAGLEKQAVALESLPEITDFLKFPALMPALQAVRDETSAAMSAARSAAMSAAWAAVTPTSKRLHESAQDLVRRMIAEAT